MTTEGPLENRHPQAGALPDYVDEDEVKSSPHSLSQAVHARRAEFTRPHQIKIKIGSWNVAACPGTEKDLGAWFVEGKGIDQQLGGLEISGGIRHQSSQDNVESVSDQEARRSKKESTLPRGDKGTIVGGDYIGLYVLGLQEVVELSSATQYIGKVYTDTSAIAKWRAAMQAAIPKGYKLVTEQQLSGLLLFVFASPTIFPTVSSVSTVSVGTGIMGYLGNKGAVATRIVLGESTRLVFVNSHLASGTDQTHLDRRCWDVAQILNRTRFEPISRAGVLDDVEEGIGEEDFAFWFGDLNFRLEGLPGADIRRLLMLHTRGEYNAGSKPLRKFDAELSENDKPIVIRSVDSDDEYDEDDELSMIAPSTTATTIDSQLPDPDDFVQDPHADPASLQATLDSLLPHDQLRHVQKAKKAFHDGWREGPITFLPTYKYDVGSVGLFDSSEKKRAPSWCDRILFRTRRDKVEYDGKSQEQLLARLKDEEMKARGIDHAADDDEVLFDYDPDADGVDGPDYYDDYDEAADNETNPEIVVTKDGFIDRIRQEVYTSHQRVLSSDHKPLDAVFSLDYDAVVPELKSKVQQEVAKELDRAENEGRPGITVVIDHSQDGDNTTTSFLTSPRKPPTDGVDGVDFGEVCYLRRKTRGVTIANTGQVSATFAFVERPGVEGQLDRVAPPWLTLSFAGNELDEDERAQRQLERQVTLEPGDTINAVLEICLEDIKAVRGLNAGEAQLDDILVLRVTDGRDHFIPIRARWLQSCFGRSIDELIRIPEGGVRALLSNKDGRMVNRGQLVCWSAPRELFKLTEAVETLVERTVAEWAMSEHKPIDDSQTGWPFDPSSWITSPAAREVLRPHVLEALDCDSPLIDSFPVETPSLVRLEIVTEALLLFLVDLPDGIIPVELWAKLEAGLIGGAQPLKPEEMRTWVLDVLSTEPNHNISLVFLTSTISRVAAELAPTIAAPKKSPSHMARRSIDIRRSLSLRNRTSPVLPDENILRREAVNSKFATVFAAKVFRARDSGKRVEEKWREILTCFLVGNEENSR